MAAIAVLVALNEMDDGMYPAHWVFDTWEELNWMFVEGVRDEVRRLVKLLGKESPSMDELEKAAWVPQGPNNEPTFQYPDAFNMEDPKGRMGKRVGVPKSYQTYTIFHTKSPSKFEMSKASN